MTTIRSAIVKSDVSLDRVIAYLPSNYEACINQNGYVLISGVDSAGWTLDGYVLPRLASGLIFASEVTA